MKVKFWGTRGSIPTPGPNTIRYGGNTSCIQIISNSGQILILDMGTGIRELGIELNKSQHSEDINIFLSHTHSDHINGFPFFEPAYIPGKKINIHAPFHFEKTLAEIMSSQMDYSYFPVTTAELNANIKYTDLKEEKFTVGEFTIETKYMNHPIISLAYKITADGKTVVYTGDTEPYYNIFGEDSGVDDAEEVIKEENERTRLFIANSDLLICDAQYTEEEYKIKKGWGHSTVEHDVNIAHTSNIKKLVLFHHDPQHSDEDVDNMLALAKKMLKDLNNTQVEVFAAAEKQEIVA